MHRFIILHVVIFALMHFTFAETINKDKLKINFSWKTIDYYYPSDAARQQAVNEGSFIPGSAVPIDVDIHAHKRTGVRVFMTTPRFSDGIPTTVGYASNEVSGDGSVLIKPYPNYEKNRIDGNCDKIISVYRVQVDECNRLWVLDTGIYKNIPICPPKLLLYNLLNDQLIYQYNFDIKSIMNNTQLITPVVDIRNGECENAFVYIADVERYQLFVFDYGNKKSWSIRNRHFYPEPDHGTFTINNLSFDLMDGIFGMALGPIMKSGDRILFFHSLASLKEKFVLTSVIRNSTKFEGNPGAEVQNFKQSYYERSSQSASEAFSKNGVLFYGSLSENSIKCWNISVPFIESNVDTALKDNQLIEFTAGLKVTKHTMGPELLIINSIAYQKMVNGVMNSSEINFRIWGAYVDELISNTKCANPHQHSQ